MTAKDFGRRRAVVSEEVYFLFRCGQVFYIGSGYTKNFFWSAVRKRGLIAMIMREIPIITAAAQG